jgi:hypothetical protein
MFYFHGNLHSNTKLTPEQNVAFISIRGSDTRHIIMTRRKFEKLLAVKFTWKLLKTTILFYNGIPEMYVYVHYSICIDNVHYTNPLYNL